MFKNMNQKRVVLILALVFVVTAALSGIIFVAQYGSSGFSVLDESSMYENTIDEEKTSSLQNIKTIFVQDNSEDINLLKTEADEIKAHFHGGYSASDDTYKPKLVVEKNGSNLIIKIDKGPSRVFFSYRSNLKLDVYIPAQFTGSLDVDTNSGEITTEELVLQNLKIASTSGNIDTQYIQAGNVQIDTTSGEITIKGKFDTLRVKSTSGNLRSDLAKAGSTVVESTSGEIMLSGSLDGISAKTSSGNIIINTDLFSKDADIESTSGEVMLNLPENAGFKLDCKTNSGDINCQFPVTVTSNNNEDNLIGTVGNGERNMKIKTSSGNIDILK